MNAGRLACAAMAAAIGLSLALPVGSARAAGDPGAGKERATLCVACHGADGISLAPIYPNLACQKEQYLVDSLKQYKSGKRDNPLMKPMVATLSEADIENLAAYYANLGCK